MRDLKDIKCAPCIGISELIPREKMEEYLQKLPEWDVVELNEINRLRRSFAFGNFVDALSFTNRVGAIAEAEDHHLKSLQNGVKLQ